MLDPSDFLSFPARLLLGVLRILWWLAWDVCVETVGWAIGWPICRLVSLGRFPVERYSEPSLDDSPAALLVDVVGLLALGAAIWYLSGDWPL